MTRSMLPLARMTICGSLRHCIFLPDVVRNTHILICILVISRGEVLEVFSWLILYIGIDFGGVVMARKFVGQKLIPINASFYY
jgi:hypothetical protein